jgi:hypothetical protein
VILLAYLALREFSVDEIAQAVRSCRGNLPQHSIKVATWRSPNIAQVWNQGAWYSAYGESTRLTAFDGSLSGDGRRSRPKPRRTYLSAIQFAIRWWASST